ncbi:MAG: hypothetical protein GC146_04575 [Limimaricola sp.]|uniref:SRPBCC domain-containing protein n=1 Tax=Limimaricola sp. TaxID=2211665 RepID=UPI001D3708C2|nr:SRPBCC domain-containing protein [Limimaricola sp.]MBI1416479.1 hypothetical protein [Limimaricola sp.]
MTAAIRKTVTVPLRPDAAFDLFTKGLDTWWPKAANGDRRPRKLRLDPRKGGHLTETRADGETARWATVTRWEPGRNLSLAWVHGGDADEASEVVVVFTPVDDGTRVDLTHAGIGSRRTEMAMLWTHAFLRLPLGRPVFA